MIIYLKSIFCFVLVVVMCYTGNCQDLKSEGLFPHGNFIGRSMQGTVNINNKLGVDSQDIKKAIGFFLNYNPYYKAKTLCSCVVLNNVSQDNEIYIITAEHCIDNKESGSELAWYF